MAVIAVRIADRLARLPGHGWRGDPDVPAFPDDRPLIVFDGVCALCSAFARFVVARDPEARFRFTAAQSPLGFALYRHLGLDPVNYETNLLIADGRVFAKMDAFVEIMRRLGGICRLAGAVGVLPGSMSDRLYDAVAGNRYRVFGRTEHCMRPDTHWRDRVIE